MWYYMGIIYELYRFYIVIIIKHKKNMQIILLENKQALQTCQQNKT